MDQLNFQAHVVFKYYREYLGMTQMDLAVKMGTTQTTVARWESGAASITAQVMQHVTVLVERKLYRDLRLALTKLVPQLTLADYEGIFAVPSPKLTIDRHGLVYLGLIEVMGHREHAFYISVSDGRLYAINRENQATLVDEVFIDKLKVRGVLHEQTKSKDDPLQQRARIRRIAEECCSGADVIFDDAQPMNWIRFRLDDPNTGRILGTPSGHYHVSEIADMPEDNIRMLVRALNPYAVQAIG
ncbi:MAG: helix-turn-helix transcriptional regulator [Edaphobacter sp.]